MDNLDTLQELLSHKRSQVRAQYNRILPTGELVYDRFAKAAELGAGEHSSVYDSCLVLGDVTIGEHVWVGPDTVLDGFHEQLSIGNWVTIAAGTCIYTHDSSKHYLSGGRDKSVSGPVSIGNCSVIGTLCVINPGVSIGDHCLIGSHSLVNSAIPNNAIAMGIPARVVGEIKVSDEGIVSYIWHNKSES